MMFSWLLEQVLGNLPTWLWPTIAGGSAVVYFLAHIIGNFPNFKPYALFIKPVAFVSILVSVFMFGGAGVTDILQAQIKEQEAKAAAAEVKSQETNVVVKKVYIDRVKKVKELQIVYQDRIKEIEKRIDADCKVAPEAIGILNDAAKLRKGTVTIEEVKK